MSFVNISKEEKITYLTRLIGKVLKILHLVEEKQHDYKIYLGGLMIDIHSANDLFDNQLIDILIKLNSIYINDFEYKQLRKIILECKNNINFLLEHIQKSEEGVIDNGKSNSQ